jgi:hypothetical protein
MTDEHGGAESKPGQWIVVLLAWAAVGIPLLWGVWMTLRKAAVLFK